MTKIFNLLENKKNYFYCLAVFHNCFPNVHLFKVEIMLNF